MPAPRGICLGPGDRCTLQFHDVRPQLPKAFKRIVVDRQAIQGHPKTTAAIIADNFGEPDPIRDLVADRLTRDLDNNLPGYQAAYIEHPGERLTMGLCHACKKARMDLDEQQPACATRHEIQGVDSAAETVETDECFRHPQGIKSVWKSNYLMIAHYLKPGLPPDHPVTIGIDDWLKHTSDLKVKKLGHYLPVLLSKLIIRDHGDRTECRRL